MRRRVRHVSAHVKVTALDGGRDGAVMVDDDLDAVLQLVQHAVLDAHKAVRHLLAVDHGAKAVEARHGAEVDVHEALFALEGKKEG